MTRNTPYYAPDYFRPKYLQNNSPSLPLPSIPPLGIFKDGVFAPSKETKKFLNSFVNENLSLQPPNIKVVQEGAEGVDSSSYGYFEYWNPDRVTLVNRKDGGLDSGLTLPHEARHYRNYWTNPSAFEERSKLPYIYDEQLTRDLSGLVQTGTPDLFRSWYNTVFDNVGMLDFSSAKLKKKYLKQSNDPERAKGIYVSITGGPTMEEELSARQAEKEYLERFYPSQLQNWQADEWTGLYPLSSAQKFNDEVLSRIMTDGPRVNPDNTSYTFRDVNGVTTDAVPFGLLNSKAQSELPLRLNAAQTMSDIMDDRLTQATNKVNRILGTQLRYQ